MARSCGIAASTHEQEREAEGRWEGATRRRPSLRLLSYLPAEELRRIRGPQGPQHSPDSQQLAAEDRGATRAEASDDVSHSGTGVWAVGRTSAIPGRSAEPGRGLGWGTAVTLHRALYSWWQVWVPRLSRRQHIEPIGHLATDGVLRRGGITQAWRHTSSSRKLVTPE